MDPILKPFLETQCVEGMRLADNSDLLDLKMLNERCYVATFSCKGLIRDTAGEVHEHDHFEVAINFSENHLRVVNPAEILTWLGPRMIWHPNIKEPFICIGDISPGTSLVDLLHRCFEVISGDNIVMREDDALNPPACAWARHNRDRFPVDTRPIKRATPDATFNVAEVNA